MPLQCFFIHLDEYTRFIQHMYGKPTEAFTIWNSDSEIPHVLFPALAMRLLASAPAEGKIGILFSGAILRQISQRTSDMSKYFLFLCFIILHQFELLKQVFVTFSKLITYIPHTNYSYCTYYLQYNATQYCFHFISVESCAAFHFSCYSKFVFHVFHLFLISQDWWLLYQKKEYYFTKMSRFFYFYILLSGKTFVC